MKKLITLVLLFNGMLYGQPIPNNDEVEFKEDIIFDNNVYLGNDASDSTIGVGTIAYELGSKQMVFGSIFALTDHDSILFHIDMEDNVFLGVDSAIRIYNTTGLTEFHQAASVFLQIVNDSVFGLTNDRSDTLIFIGLDSLYRIGIVNQDIVTVLGLYPESFVSTNPEEGITKIEASNHIVLDASIQYPYSTSNVSNPPTQAELDAAFGSAPVDGFTARVKDSNSNNLYECMFIGTDWYVFSATIAP